MPPRIAAPSTPKGERWQFSAPVWTLSSPKGTAGSRSRCWHWGSSNLRISHEHVRRAAKFSYSQSHHQPYFDRRSSGGSRGIQRHEDYVTLCSRTEPRRVRRPRQCHQQEFVGPEHADQTRRQADCNLGGLTAVRLALTPPPAMNRRRARLHLYSGKAAAPTRKKDPETPEGRRSYSYR